MWTTKLILWEGVIIVSQCVKVWLPKDHYLRLYVVATELNSSRAREGLFSVLPLRCWQTGEAAAEAAQGRREPTHVQVSRDCSAGTLDVLENQAGKGPQGKPTQIKRSGQISGACRTSSWLWQELGDLRKGGKWPRKQIPPIWTSTNYMVKGPCCLAVLQSAAWGSYGCGERRKTLKIVHFFQRLGISHIHTSHAHVLS